MNAPAAQTGSLPNRAHYLKAALAGGGVGALLSMIPILNMLNMLFGLLIMCGGAFAVWMVQKKTQSVQVLEASFLGGLAGLVTGLILFFLVSLFGVPLWALAIAEAPGSQEEEMLAVGAAAFFGSCCVAITIYPLIGAIGGAIGGLIFKPDPSAAGVTGPDGRPLPKPEPTAEDLAKRARLKKVAMVTCAGCLGISMVMCGISGYLVYLESRDVEDTAGSPALVEVPHTPGQLQQLTIPSPNSGSVLGLWLVSDSALPPGIHVTGRGQCRASYGGTAEVPTYISQLFVYRGPDENHPEWILIDTEYPYGADSYVCHYEVNTDPPVTGARIVVTEHRTPSDWLD